MELWGVGNLQQIRKHHTRLERLRDIDQIQRILIDGNLLREQRRIVRAQETAAVRVDADAEVADADFEFGFADDIGDGGRDAGVDLRRAVGGRVVLVVEGYEEDSGDEGGGGGAAGE